LVNFEILSRIQIFKAFGSYQLSQKALFIFRQFLAKIQDYPGRKMRVS